MPIERGGEWGSAAVLPLDAPVCVTDAAAAETVAAALGAAPNAQPVVALSGGDLCATLGGRGTVADRRGTDTQLLPCDMGVVSCRGERHLFVAHCLVVPRLAARLGHISWLRGTIVAAMNAAWVGAWNVAPRAHPGDGRLDVVTVAPTMRVGQRIHAYRRLPHGGHIPHPGISVRRSRADAPVQPELPNGGQLIVDGVDRGVVDAVTFDVMTDVFLAAV